MTAPGFTVTRFGVAELEIAATLHRAAFDFEAWNAKSLGEVLAMPGAVALMALGPGADGPAPLGFLMGLLVAQDAEILTLAVPPSLRRRGIATLLVDEFLTLAGGLGATNAFLEVAEDNGPAQKLYSRLGFRMEGRRKDYYKRPGNRRVSAHLLRRPLP